MTTTRFLLLTLLLLSCGKPTPQAADSAIPRKPWPVFRGTSALSGTADADIGSNPKPVWNYLASRAPERDDVPDPLRSSPIIVSNTVFVGSLDGRLHAVDLDSGNVRWISKLESQLEAPPFYHGGLVYIGSVDGRLFAVNAGNGRIVWRRNFGDKITGSANLLMRGGRPHIVFGCHDNSLYCLDASTGKTAWVYRTDNFINGTPLVAGGVVSFGGCDEKLHLVDGRTGRARAVLPAGGYVAGSPAASKGILYAGHYQRDVFAASINPPRILWRYRGGKQGASFFSSPAVHNGKVYIGCRDHRLYCLDAKTGKRLWAFRTGERVDASPIIYRDRIIVPSMDGRVYMLRARDGKMLWKYEIGTRLSASPAISGSMLVIAAEDGRLYCFRGE